MTTLVIAGLVPAIPVPQGAARGIEMAGSSSAMTAESVQRGPRVKPEGGAIARRRYRPVFTLVQARVTMRCERSS